MLALEAVGLGPLVRDVRFNLFTVRMVIGKCSEDLRQVEMRNLGNDLLRRQALLSGNSHQTFRGDFNALRDATRGIYIGNRGANRFLKRRGFAVEVNDRSSTVHPGSRVVAAGGEKRVGQVIGKFR